MDEQLKEKIIKYGMVEISDAATAIWRGTTKRGNSIIAPIEAMRKHGFVPKKLMPLERWMRWEDYHNPKRITSEIEALGLETTKRFPINYERVYEKDFKNVRKYDLINVAGYAWPDPINGIYPRVSYTPNHVFVDIPKTAQYTIFDNYLDRGIENDFIKRLASDYDLLDYGYRIILNEVSVMDDTKKKMEMETLTKIYQELLLREPDQDALPYLRFDEDFVRQEVGKSEEREQIIKLVNWARNFKLMDFFKGLEIIGQIKTFAAKAKDRGI